MRMAGGDRILQERHVCIVVAKDPLMHRAEYATRYS